MISVLKHEESIVIRCSKSEYINIDKIKGIVKTIKRIDKSNDSPCTIVIKSLEEIRFTLHGEQFYNRLMKSNVLSTSRINYIYED